MKERKKSAARTAIAVRNVRNLIISKSYVR